MSHLRGPDWTHGQCTTPEQYRALQAAAVQRNRQQAPGRYRNVQVHAVPARVAAYVNHGRWLLDCPCGNGVATHPEWRVGCCFACGAVFEDIAFPDDAAAIDAALSTRPVALQNWVPGETVADLQAEAQAHEAGG